MKKIICFAIICFSFWGCKEKEVTEPAGYARFEQIPVSEITPEGWLREILQRQRDGLGLNRDISGHPYNTCLWDGVIPQGGNPWAKAWWAYEQSAYLLDGLYKCGELLDDSVLINLGQRNVAYVISHPRTSGQLGPDCLGDSQWAFSVFARVLMANYEVTKDPAILASLTKHFLSLPDSLTNRQACIIESMCWTYSQTKDKQILDKAENIWKIFSVDNHPDNEFFRESSMIAGDSISVHGVTAAEVGKLPALLYLQTGKDEYKQAALGFLNGVEKYHELPDAIPSSSEKLGGKSPEALHETCDISDFTWSYGYLLMATGDVKWADKIEQAVYNAGMGAICKDFKAHQYFSSPNQLFATQYSSTAPYGEEGLIRQAYRPGFDVECCTGNVHRIFPNFASRLWMKDQDGGIVAALYAPSVLRTQAGKKGRSVEIEEITDYPFSGRVVFKIKGDQPVEFPFSFRIPEWTGNATVRINGETETSVKGNTFHTIKRTFKPGDEIVLELPMEVRKEQWTGNGISINRGPLLFSLLIKEKVTEIADQVKTSMAFPAYDITPDSPWNYALLNSGEISVETTKVEGFPWIADNSPVKLTAKAIRIPGWKAEKNTPALPVDISTVDGDVEEIKLVPSGSTRIRLSVFPSYK